MSRRAVLAKVHLAKRDLGLDDETYRDVLERVAGRRSAAECTQLELSMVLADFYRRGWAPSPAAGAPSSNTPHVRKVWAVWGDMCKSGAARTPTRAALRAFVKRMTGLSDPEWMTPAQAGVVIEGLKAMRARAS